MFFFGDALILLICVFLYVNLYVSARIVSRIYFNQDILFKKINNLSHYAYKNMIMSLYFVVFELDWFGWLSLFSL